ncbi:MAG TPA: uroporphyrinogen-III synthase [Bryobacteraceae bacterium]|nr:uroporphyrinogen-III synthase [Bryobacteraceae bacterium]
MGFDGIRVVSLESRRATEIEKLIRIQGGEPFVAPSMREVPLERNEEAFRFAERLFAGEFDMMVLLTGVGTRTLDRLLATRYPAGRFAEALRSITVVARGPKPAAALREMDVPVTVSVPAPNTWREILAAAAVRPERRMAVQEYGRSNEELLAGLRALGREVTPVRIYQWDLPEDTGPLREAARRIASGLASVVMFTTANQVPHLFRIASEEGVEEAMRRGLGQAVVASIGPTTSEMLEEYDIQPDVVPSQSKMGILVRETAEQASGILERKRADR